MNEWMVDCEELIKNFGEAHTKLGIAYFTAEAQAYKIAEWLLEHQRVTKEPGLLFYISEKEWAEFKKEAGL